MKVEVRLFATLRDFLPPSQRGAGGATALELPDGSTVADLGRALGIPGDMPRVTLVNGEDAEPERKLAPDDVVTLFPPLAGGGR